MPEWELLRTGQRHPAPGDGPPLPAAIASYARGTRPGRSARPGAGGARALERRSRAEHGESELLDEIVSAKPKVDHTRYHSAEELRDNWLGHLRDAMTLLERKATAEERGDYRHFVLTLASKVAAAHREHGQSVSPAEAAAIQQITAAPGTTGS